VDIVPQEDTNNPHPIPLTTSKPPPNKPRPPRGLFPEWGPGLSVADRRRNANFNEDADPQAAIAARCMEAGYGLTNMTEGELIQVAQELGWPVAETMWVENTGRASDRIIAIANRAGRSVVHNAA
jgi:hypothetical protein